MREEAEDRFEKEWREAMEDFSQGPPASVWGEIDRQLTYADLAAYKTKAGVYQWATAAAVVFAAALGIYLITFSQSDLDQSLAVSENTNHPIPVQELPPVVAEVQPVQEPRSPAIASAISPVIAPEEKEEILQQFALLELDKKDANVKVVINFQEKDLYKRPVYLGRSRKSSTGSADRFWAGVGLGGGSFDPNFQSGGNALASSADGLISRQTFSNAQTLDTSTPDIRQGMAGGESMALAMNFGMKLSDRWTLESGVQYTRAGAVTQTNILIETTQLVESLPATTEIQRVPQVANYLREDVINYVYEDVDLDNQFQFASLPVKAGYLLVNSKLSVELNAGVAANVYLGNRLTDPGNQVANVTIGPGESSPYRDVSFSGLAGLQVGYRFFGQFDVVLEPNYRRAISSLTKDDIGFTANPSGFALMTGVRYRFK